MLTNPPDSHQHNNLIGKSLAALAKSRRIPRLFTIDYDCTKLKSRSPVSRAEFAKRMNCEGTEYTNGRITLDTGVMFRNMAELKEHFEQMGAYALMWLDEESHA